MFVLGDRSAEGDGVAELFRVSAGKQGLDVAGEDRMDPRASDYRDLGRKVAAARPDIESAADPGSRVTRCLRSCAAA